MSENFGYDVTMTVGAAAVVATDLVKTPAAIVVTAAVTDDPCGVVMEGAAIGALARVRIFGICRVRAASAIAFGEPLQAAAAGEVDNHDGTTTQPIIGTALEAATAANDEILAFIGSHGFRAGFAA